jgi:hypothetical protein
VGDQLVAVDGPPLSPGDIGQGDETNGVFAATQLDFDLGAVIGAQKDTQLIQEQQRDRRSIPGKVWRRKRLLLIDLVPLLEGNGKEKWETLRTTKVSCLLLFPLLIS